MKVDWLIVGAGFTGATLAERIASQMNRSVLVVDSRDHVGGNAYDEYHESGILYHKYGPHIFHTASSRVWQYLSRFTEWNPYYHRVVACISGQMVPIPFNLNSLHAVFPRREADRIEGLLIDHYGFGARVPILRLRENGGLSDLANYVYEKVFSGYTLKQWGTTPVNLDASVTDRVPIAISRDDRYFQDTYQAIPRDGYTVMFRRMLRHPNIKVLLNAKYQEIERQVTYDRMAYTGPLDELCKWSNGSLPYRSIRFATTMVAQEFVQPVGTVNYPNEFDFTRVTEQKHLTGQKAANTLLISEYPLEHKPGETEPYYPVPQERNRQLHQQYLDEMSREFGSRVVFAGRLADYRYYNMDQAVARALKVFEDIAGNG